MEETRLIQLELLVAFVHFDKNNTRSRLRLVLLCRNLWEQGWEDACLQAGKLRHRGSDGLSGGSTYPGTKTLGHRAESQPGVGFPFVCAVHRGHIQLSITQHSMER